MHTHTYTKSHIFLQNHNLSVSQLKYFSSWNLCVIWKFKIRTESWLNTQSLVKRVNITGESKHPCGAPVFKVKEAENWPLTVHDCCREESLRSTCTSEYQRLKDEVCHRVCASASIESKTKINENQGDKPCFALRAISLTILTQTKK